MDEQPQIIQYIYQHVATYDPETDRNFWIMTAMFSDDTIREWRGWITAKIGEFQPPDASHPDWKIKVI